MIPVFFLLNRKIFTFLDNVHEVNEYLPIGNNR